MTEVVVGYLGALQVEQGASRNTLAAYRSDLTDFTEFLRRYRRTLASLAPDDLVAYLAGLRRRGLRPSSVARRMSAVRGLYRHLLREGALERDPTEHLEAPRRGRSLPRTLSRETVTALVEAPDIAEPRGVRHRALLELLYATGNPASECRDLQREDRHQHAGYVACTGQGSEQRAGPDG